MFYRPLCGGLPRGLQFGVRACNGPRVRALPPDSCLRRLFPVSAVRLAGAPRPVGSVTPAGEAIGSPWRRTFKTLGSGDLGGDTHQIANEPLFSKGFLAPCDNAVLAGEVHVDRQLQGPGKDR